MNALVKMLKNTETNRFHPIFYFESPLPGGFESETNQKLVRYKSKGHHTSGFDTREAAYASASSELVAQIKSAGYSPILELDEKDDLLWDGKEMPTDHQLRDR